MYTILMNADKTLTTTVKTNLYQKENLVDKIQFYVPIAYNEHDLTTFTATIVYADQSNVPHAEKLVADEELYKEKYIRYTLPVGSALTKLAGDIKIRLNFNKVDLEEKKQYTLHSSAIKVSILPLEDYYAFVPDESLEFVDQIVGALEAQIEALADLTQTSAKAKADNIVLDKDTNELYLTSSGNPIGDRINIGELSEEIVESANDGLIQVIL